MSATVWHHLVRATEATAGLAESNGSLRQVDGLVTCGPTACTTGSALGPILGNKYGKTLPFFKSNLRLSHMLLADYIPKWYTHSKMVNHPSTNWARYCSDAVHRKE